MRINNEYQIVSDSLNIILQKRNMKEDGSYTNWTNLTYHTDFNEALASYAKREVLGTGLQEYEMVCAKVNELMDLVRSIPAPELEKEAE